MSGKAQFIAGPSLVLGLSAPVGVEDYGDDDGAELDVQEREVAEDAGEEVGMAADLGLDEDDEEGVRRAVLGLDLGDQIQMVGAPLELGEQLLSQEVVGAETGEVQLFGDLGEEALEELQEEVGEQLLVESIVVDGASGFARCHWDNVSRIERMSKNGIDSPSSGVSCTPRTCLTGKC